MREDLLEGSFGMIISDFVDNTDEIIEGVIGMFENKKEDEDE